MLKIELRLKGAALLYLKRGKIRDKSLLSLAGSVSLLIDSLHPKAGSLSQQKKFTLGLNNLWAS
jgi:hypothetical protein